MTLGEVRDVAPDTAARRWIFRSRFPDVFVFNPAVQRIDCHIASTDDRIWQDVLLRRVIPRIAETAGALVIHAAAVATDDRCLLLLGASGAGKSTLSAFCARHSWVVLGEDTTIVWPETGSATGFMVEPVQRGIGVWDATRSALALPNADCTPMPGYGGQKFWFDPPAGTRTGPRPLSGILMLERSGDLGPCAIRLSRDAALRALLGQAIAFLPSVRPDAASAARFGRMAALATRIPCFQMTYPDGYARLPETEKALRYMTLKPA